jgi:hypothetical protein
VSIVGFLLVLGAIINKPDGWSVGWGLILVVVFAALQAVSAVGSLLLDAGVIAPPAPRPKYDQSQYGAYGPPAGYYGPPAGQSGQQPPYPGPPQHQPAQQQRPPYPQYGGYPPAPSTGGFGAQGPPTPPTGFPSFSPPQQSSAPTGQIPAQSAEQPQASESTPS